ncbi:hypothetical protein V1477_010441 [Vespula maculifrons]|uniref:Uncharacterized protein n=1 Tax=Vespula maculifrons TaxID=7453 RepID=A0ABD2C8K2_VESMC
MALEEEEEAATKKKFIRIRIKLWSGDTELREKTNSSVRLILTLTSSVLLRILTSTHRNFHSTHSPQSGDTELRETTIKSSVRPLLTVNGSALLRILTSTDRNFHSTHSPQSGDTGLRETTTNSSVRPTLTINSSVWIRISTSTHRNFHKLNYGGGDTFPPVTPIRWTLTAAELNCGVGILGFVKQQQTQAIKLWSGDTGLRETTTNSSVRPILTVNGSVLLRISTSTHRNFHSTHSPEWGYSPTRDDNISGPTATVSDLLRISTSTHCSFCSTHSLEVIEKSQYLNCEVGILGFQRQQQSRVFDRLLQLLVQLCFGLQRENLKIFVEDIRASINEELIQIYNRLFDFTLKCEVGILGFERRQQRWVFDWPIQFRVQLCFELRRENLEIFAEDIRTSINEEFTLRFCAFERL